jgi:hypothetical protein
MPEPAVIEYRRALDLKGFSKTVKVKVKSRKSGKVKVKFKVTSNNARGKTVKKKIKLKK